MQNQTKQHIASIASNILNPITVALVMLFLLALSSASSTIETLKWTGISLAVGLLPVVLVVVYLVQNDRMDGLFINTREQRTKIYILGSICMAIAFAVLTWLKAPPVLLAGFVTGFATTLIFMLINLRWKISWHTAMVADSVAVLAMLFGWMGAIGAILIPLTAWSRVELKAHSLAQTAASAVVAVLIMVLVFRPFF